MSSTTRREEKSTILNTFNKFEALVDLTDEKPKSTKKITNDLSTNESNKKETSKPWVEVSFGKKKQEKSNGLDKTQAEELTKLADKQTENTSNTIVSIQSISSKDSQGVKQKYNRIENTGN